MHLQSSTLSVPLSPEVAGFAAVMESKLRLSKFHTSWKDLSLEILQARLYDEAEAFLTMRGGDAFQAAVHLGILAMLAADRAAKEAKGRPPEALKRAAP